MPRPKKLASAPKKALDAFAALEAEYQEQLASGTLDPVLVADRLNAAMDVLATSRVAGPVRGVDMDALLSEVSIHREPITASVTPKLADAEAFAVAHGEALGEAAELHRQAADAYMETVMSLAKGALVLAAGGV